MPGIHVAVDAVRPDGRSGDFLVGYGSGGLAVIDPAQMNPIPAASPVNVPDVCQITVVDEDTGRKTAPFLLPFHLSFS